MKGARRAGFRRGFQWAVTLAILFAIYSLVARTGQLPLVGQQAPAIALPVSAGGSSDGPARVRLSDLRGEVVVLDFWASWCTACRRTTTMLNELQEAFAEAPVAFYAINVEPIDKQRVAAAHHAFGADFPTLHDRAGTVQRTYGIEMLPTVVVVGREGMVKWAGNGVPRKSELQGAIADALK